jgi:hypothetical protein
LFMKFKLQGGAIAVRPGAPCRGNDYSGCSFPVQRAPGAKKSQG